MPPRLTWAASLDRDALVADHYELIEFAALRREVIAPARQTGARRTSIDNPAQTWLDRIAHAPRLAVVGVELRDLDDLAALHGYVLEPALRAGIELAIESRQRLTRLSHDRFMDPDFAYPYTLERAIDAATRLYRASPGPEPSPPSGRPQVELDPEQLRAVNAHTGVVQVIAPAGSGKTAVLIARVCELLRRRVPAAEILCATFNRDARVELEQRLSAAGVRSVAARTFHSIGWWLMREEGLARRNGVRDPSFNQWRRLCALALRETCRWIDPADARATIGSIKLGLLATPREFAQQSDRHPDGETLALIYELYERQLAEAQLHDFDDLVLCAVRALREDGELRRRWQRRFSQVLVDEYQDIEPAQELLVRSQRGLTLHWTTGTASRFLTEAGLLAPVAVEPPAPRPRSCGKSRRADPRPAGTGLHPVVVTEAKRAGLLHALRTAPSGKAALEGAADVIEARLVGPATTSTRMSVLDLLDAIEPLDELERTALLRAAGIENPHRRLTRLHSRTRTRLVRALRELAARSPDSQAGGTRAG